MHRLCHLNCVSAPGLISSTFKVMLHVLSDESFPILALRIGLFRHQQAAIPANGSYPQGNCHVDAAAANGGIPEASIEPFGACLG